MARLLLIKRDTAPEHIKCKWSLSHRGDASIAWLAEGAASGRRYLVCDECARADAKEYPETVEPMRTPAAKAILPASHPQCKE
mgnify:CR=1 FL=1